MTVLLKLGGSLVTDKSQYRTPNLENIARLAYETSLCREKLVLVHGAGSYGHTLAKQHNLAQGATTPAQREAFATVHADVRDLHGLILSALREARLAPLGFSALDLAQLDNGELASFNAQPVQWALEHGFLPVLHGDAVFDRSRTTSILSGDEIMVALARELKPRLAIFATDVDGLMDRDPRDPAALHIPRVQAKTLRDVLAQAAGPSRHADVTGGMAGKAQRILKLTDLGAPVRVVNGNVPGRLTALLQGENTLSTEVVP